MGQADRQSRRKQPGSQPASKPANTVVAEDCAVFCSVLRCQPCHQLVVRYVPILALLPDAVYMFTNGWENLRFTIPPLTIPPFVVSPRGPKGRGGPAIAAIDQQLGNCDSYRESYHRASFSVM